MWTRLEEFGQKTQENTQKYLQKSIEPEFRIENSQKLHTGKIKTTVYNMGNLETKI